MVKIIRLVWGVLPVAIVSLCWIFISVIERITGDTLRNFYRNLLIFFVDNQLWDCPPLGEIEI